MSPGRAKSICIIIYVYPHLCFTISFSSLSLSLSLPSSWSSFPSPLPDAGNLSSLYMMSISFHVYSPFFSHHYHYNNYYYYFLVLSATPLSVTMSSLIILICLSLLSCFPIAHCTSPFCLFCLFVFFLSSNRSAVRYRVLVHVIFCVLLDLSGMLSLPLFFLCLFVKLSFVRLFVLCVFCV